MGSPTRARSSRRVKTPNGAGSIRKRADGRWEARYTVADPENEAPLRRSLYGSSEVEVRSKLIVALGAVQSGGLVVNRGREPSLGQWIEDWLQRVRVRPNTLRGYRGYLRNHVVPVIGSVPLSRLSVQQVEDLLTSLHDRGLEARSCNHCRAILRACLRDAKRRRGLPRNVAGLARPLPLDDLRRQRR
jgi:hypothetical protein